MFDTENQQLPNLLMYKADDFEMNLRLGERGIIYESRIQSSSKLYLLNADNCFDDFFAQKNWLPGG